MYKKKKWRFIQTKHLSPVHGWSFICIPGAQLYSRGCVIFIFGVSMGKSGMNQMEDIAKTDITEC